MKELKFNKVSFLKENILSRNQMKNLIGGYGEDLGCPPNTSPWLCFHADGTESCHCYDIFYIPGSSECYRISMSCDLW